MKKILFAVLFLFTLNITYGANLYLRGGFAVGGNLKIDGLKKEKIKNSFIGSTELTVKILNLEAGAGVGYEGNPKLKSGNDLELDMVPIYLVGKVNFFGPYIVGRLGKSVPVPKDDLKNYVDNNDLKIKIGNYLSLGVGYEIALFLVEAAYSISKGGIDGGNIKFSKFSIVAGVKF